MPAEPPRTSKAWIGWNRVVSQMSTGSSDLGRLLGRADEVQLLISLLDGVESGGGALVIRGESGVGKSRLLSETAG